MTLATRCPRCGTVYRLVAGQLKLHHTIAARRDTARRGARHARHPIINPAASARPERPTPPSQEKP
ncbi:MULTISPECIES: hypothetical protein [Mycetohabitans]|uniref:Transposase n=1 Tax=Mycetohabitans rhizoxinica TaxID=412963 RepID=A0ABZ2Q4G8_9BURK|nr:MULTISPECIES: hypothetical protein [Mycetohabitans]MCG1046185.1 hypothetical protein [Mycetohabitans sp. B6]